MAVEAGEKTATLDRGAGDMCSTLRRRLRRRKSVRSDARRNGASRSDRWARSI